MDRVPDVPDWLVFSGTFLDGEPLYKLSADMLRVLGQAVACTERRSALALPAWLHWRSELLAQLQFYHH